MFFLLLVLAEFSYKVLQREFHLDFKVSAGLKILLQGFFAVQIARTDYRKLWPIAALLGIFFLGQFGMVSTERLQQNLWFFDKYIFVILALVYVTTLKKVWEYYPLFSSVFKWFLIVNSICILVGVIFSINIFGTYKDVGLRFGYDGLILRPGAATYIYWIALFYAAREFIHKKSKHILFFLLVLVASFCIGTKAMLIAYFFLAMYLFIAIGWHKKWLGIFSAVVTISLGIFLSYYLIDWMVLNSPSLQKVMQERGLFSVLVSLRDAYLMEEMIPLIKDQWTWRNYLFGGGFDMHFRSQFGLLDLFYFFGMIGMSLYLWVFYKLFVPFKKRLGTIIFLTGTFVMMAFSANFFYETILGIYLVFAKLYLEKIEMA